MRNIIKKIGAFFDYLRKNKETIVAKHRKRKFTSGWWRAKYNKLERRRMRNKMASASRRKNRA
jgi:hypothetical protein